MNIKNKNCFVFDLDGTVYMGDRPIQGTINFIKNNIGKKGIYFMTNNTSKTPDEYVERLKRFEINISIDQIISPFIPLFKYFKDQQIKYIFLLANKKVEQYILSHNPDISLTDDINKCEAIVVTFDTELTYEKLKIASLLLQNKNNIRYVATHPDNVCPTNEGNIPDVGGFMKIIEITSGKRPDFIFGKPNIELLTSVLAKYNKEECAIVGDRLYTDKKLADNAMIDFILVLSGETKRHEAETQEHLPAMIVDDLGIFNTENYVL